MSSEERGVFKPLFLTVVLIALIIFSAILLGKYFGIDQPYFLSRLFPGRAYEVTRASKNLPIAEEPHGTIDLSELTELRKMLDEERFEELNAVLATYQDFFEKDQSDEYKLHDAYNAFYITSPHYEYFLEKWVKATPETYQPYLAIAEYYYAKGWESRGYSWKKETSEEQFREMGLFFEKAEKNLQLALKIKPDLMVAYNILIGIYNANGDDESEDEMIIKTSELFPYSFLVKSTCSWAKEPRWGGSYLQMEVIAENAEEYVEKNPKLPVLYGFIYYDQARIYEHNKNYKKALELLEKAFSFGEEWSYYNERAEIYFFNLKEYDAALEDINRSIELRPLKDENYLLRSRINFVKENYADSIADLHTAEIIRPGSPESARWRELASKNFMNQGHRLIQTELRNAVKKYDMAIEFNDNNFEAHYWRGVAFNRLGDNEAALSDFNAAVQANPHHFDSYRMIDYLLSKKQQWGLIITYWNRFIAVEPDHADAYYERSGSYYHNRDMENAVHDLEKACELGNQDACKRYKMLKR